MSDETAPPPRSPRALDALRARLGGSGAEPHIPGEAGLWVFLIGDMTVFAMLFGVYLDARAKEPALFDAERELLGQHFGAINTLLLLCSSLLVVAGVHALRSGTHHRLAARFFGGAFVVGGCGFVAMKAVEWIGKFSDGITPATNDFWTYYYVLTGLHLFHLLVGMGVLAFVYSQARKPGLSPGRFSVVEGGACYWHMVDLLWIVIFPLLYLVH